MYATGDSYCPVEMLRLLIKKTTPKANALFNSCYPKVIRVYKSFGYSFNDKPIKRRTFVNLLPGICKSIGCNKKNTAHCLRTTAITAMNDSCFEARHNLYLGDWVRTPVYYASLYIEIANSFFQL